MLPYAELRCKTNFSFLTGASHADELIPRAATLQYNALAITDIDSLSGIVRAWSARRDFLRELDEYESETGKTLSCNKNLKLIYGAEITPTDAPPVLLWAPTHAAYKNLSQLITVGRRRAAKGECELTFEDVATHSGELLAGVIPETTEDSQSLQAVHQYRDLFGDRAYLMASLHRSANDPQQLANLQTLSDQTNLPLVACGDVHYHTRERMKLFDVVTAIRTGTTVDAAGHDRFANAERHLRHPQEIYDLFSAAPEVVARTLEVAERCHFTLDELRYQYPRELAPEGMTTFEYLRQLTWKGAGTRYPQGVPDKVTRLINHELELIEELHYEAYFITVWDLVRFARSRDILCQGRGSAANSAVCYCLGVTAVDPDRTDVLFERFISRERNEAPDIDVDFEHERREEVLQYLYDKYGRDRAAMTGVVTTYRIRSAIRDVGKALGLSLDRVDALAKQVDGRGGDSQLPVRCRDVGIDPESLMGQRLIQNVSEILGFPRHLSQHVGGMVMTEGPLCELAPIENAAMDGRTVICWDKNDLEDLGILKVDCLGLGMLSAIRRCFAMIKKHTGRSLTLANIPAEDPAVYDMVCRADTIGLFQIESRAQMSMLPRLKPRCYYDLVIEVAIVRPGPIQGQMVHPYLRRRSGEEEVTYANDEIRQVLEKTLGVPIFQEQAMQLAVVAAGFTPGEADQLRRAMGKWRKTGVMEKFRHKLIDGMRKRNLPEEFAQQVFQQIRGFGEYGFPESHAASFALLVYVSAYLKYYHPATYAACIINSQPMGFYAPAQLIRDAKEHGVQILPIDVNHSDWDCTLENAAQPTPSPNRSRTRKSSGRSTTSHTTSSAPSPPKLSTGNPDPPAIRLGLRLINGLAERHAETIVDVRSTGLFKSQEEFAKRTRLSRSVITQLADADALASLGRDRRQALWEALAQEHQPRDFPLFDSLAAEDEAPVALPEINGLENVFADYETFGLSLRNHPIAFFRDQLTAFGVTAAEDLATMENDDPVSVAGMVILRQRPSTAKGITFVTLEDETGAMNLVVFQNIWEKFYTVARRSPAWVAYGKVETKHSVIHVVVHRIVDFSKSVNEHEHQFSHHSRDFR